MGATIERHTRSRREVLLGALAGAGGIAALGASATATQAAKPAGVARLTLDVACLGDTLRLIVPPGYDFDGDGAQEFPRAHLAGGDLRGVSYTVEGHIYPAGTIARDGFNPSSATPVGTWFSRGWFIINGPGGRPDPFAITTHEYVLGAISAERLFPPDTLTSSGLDTSSDDRQAPRRAVTGGTGRYDGAHGTVVQRTIGHNTTRLAGFGNPAHDFRFEFELVRSRERKDRP